MQVRCLEKGGFTAYGHAWYDARNRAVISQAREGETQNLTARFPQAISSINYETNGAAETTEPVITTSTFTARLSNFRAGATVRYDIELADDSVVMLNVWFDCAPQASPPGYSSDYGDFA